ncbi:MAG: peptide/nickel transport system ATP-binding protein [Solirubrobacteraceae bacterium]|jgi:peptide/nickel transport system ATP-binding protein|nr:peptide/nickel transport system ATP-binding protein [Solirubrobacteraceae bacterium]
MSDAGGGPLLAVRDVSVRFDTDDGALHAVDGVSFDVARGEVLAIVGESGCGKSVTTMSLLGLLPDTATVCGEAHFGGVQLIGAPAAALRRIRGREISFVFQDPMTSLNPVFTVGRQIGEVLRRHLGMSRADTRSRTVELLGLVGIPSPERRVDEYPHQLSGGMRQRVMIAMAIACEPKVLIADEPTTALDVTIQAAVLDVLRELRERLGMAIVLITHDLGVVADVADRVIIMYAGQKVEEAPVEELFAHPQHPYTIGLLGAVPHAPAAAAGNGRGRRRLVEIPGRVPALTAPPDHCPFAPRCPRADDRSRSEVPALETVRPEHLVACFHPGEREAVAP